MVVGVSIPLRAEPSRIKAILDPYPYDFVFTDGQHSALNEERVVEFCHFLDELGLPVQLRIKHTRHAYLVGNTLDLGPFGVEVPQVELEATAREAVASVYYPPTGARSFAMPRKGPTVPTDRLAYAQWCNEREFLCLQLESVDAVTNARRLAVPGVDYFSFGPSDLTFSLEAHPEHSLKTVDDCVRHVIEQLADSDVAVGFRSTADQREFYADMGVTVFLERPQV